MKEPTTGLSESRSTRAPLKYHGELEDQSIFTNESNFLVGDGGLFGTSTGTKRDGTSYRITWPLKTKKQPPHGANWSCAPKHMCVCAESGKELVFQGTLRKMVTEMSNERRIEDTEPSTRLKAKKEEVKFKHPDNWLPPSVETPKEKERRSKETDDTAEFEAALKYVSAMKGIGADPEVSIKIFSWVARKSIQTLYRHQANGLCPRPSKRGRSSTWKWSEVEAYVAGSWHPTPTL